MVEPALTELLKILKRADTNDTDRLRAIREVLNRTGLSEQMILKLVPGTDDPWAGLVGDALELDRSMTELSPSPVGGGEVEDDNRYDRQVLQASMSDDNWRDLRREDEEAEEVGRIRPDEHTVRGEVIDIFPDPGRSPAGASEMDPSPGGRYGDGPRTSGSRRYESGE